MDKLGGSAVGDWLKKASDSLLYYHITGTTDDLHFEVKRGDGSPIVAGVKKVADSAGHAVGSGIQKAGHIIGGLFGH